MDLIPLTCIVNSPARDGNRFQHLWLILLQPSLGAKDFFFNYEGSLNAEVSHSVYMADLSPES